MLCAKCFGDIFLEGQIVAISKFSIPVCSYCGTEQVSGVQGPDIADIVSPILGLYIPTDSGGASLHSYLKQDWLLLPNLTDASAEALIDEIFPVHLISTKLYRPRRSETGRLNIWETFQAELKHQNRFFPQTKVIEPNTIRALFESLVLTPIPRTLYRARIWKNNDGFSPADMGKPPNDLVKGGRANPIGISYLYTASDQLTALSEVRPSIGDTVSVARFDVRSELALLDLRNPRLTASPFNLDEDILSALFNEMEFLIKLGEQLSKPVLPKDADLEYLASQYLCEQIKHLNYDGVVYKSSVGNGFNVALFQEGGLHMSEDLQTFHVDTLEYGISESLSF